MIEDMGLTDEKEPRLNLWNEWLRLELEEGRRRKGRLRSRTGQRIVEGSS